MNASDILRQNHDIHLHSRDYSDAWHSIRDVAEFALRWTEGECWVGISDHGPSLTAALASCYPEMSQIERQKLDAHFRVASLDEAPVVLVEMGRCISAYIEHARRERVDMCRSKDVSLLIGLETEWLCDCASAPETGLRMLDYVLLGFHGCRFSSASEVEREYDRMTGCYYADVVVHPDKFLGAFDVRTCNWNRIFSTMSERGICCEYNLRTPLCPDVFHAAVESAELRFVIGSDTHDFRSRGVSRIMDAWGESQAGGFELARNYLCDILARGDNSGHDSLCRFFETPEALDLLESHVYARTRRFQPADGLFSPDMNRLIAYLSVADDSRDREFMTSRLARFIPVQENRIVSTYSQDRFLQTVRSGRAQRVLKGDTMVGGQ